MNIFLLLSVVALVHQAACNGPSLGFDPDTAADCIDWYDNGYGESCEEVLKYFHITPEEFHKWNPSVGLDCKPWQYLSYCILTLEKWNTRPTTTTSSSTTTTSTTKSATLEPSPTSWSSLGCYYQDSQLQLLEENLSPAGGDTALTIPKCQNTCYLRSYNIAGVQEGNQCWCSTYAAGLWTLNQTDCNIPCTGDKNTFCGGKEVFNVFKAEENMEPLPTTASSATTSSADSTASTVSSATPTSGAMRNMAMF
ncbi:hypothetical protein V494_05711 [Pseudogymnoascus sp. VKM F-4513 (FW-928)]|nr:hypothetical protein V494_05711 [Pseudogymnoascus sp. VKM F-4513 (FW-928)]